MRKLSLPRERNGYIPTGLYEHPQAGRKERFMELFSVKEDNDKINRRRMENLKGLRGATIEPGIYIYVGKIRDFI